MIRYHITKYLGRYLWVMNQGPGQWRTLAGTYESLIRACMGSKRRNDKQHEYHTFATLAECKQHLGGFLGYNQTELANCYAIFEDVSVTQPSQAET